MSVRWFIAIGLCALLTQSLYAQPATTLPEIPAENEQPQPPAAPPTLDEQLRAILETIQAVEAERTAINRQLRRTPNVDEAQKLKEQAEQFTRRLQDLQISFEELATKGLSTVDLKPKPATQFDWQQELEEVIRPLLDELKQLTERPRTIERLRGEQTLAENQLQIAEKAIGRLENTLQQVEAPAVTQALKKVLEQWRDHYEEAENRLQRINAQLERLTAPSDETVGERFAATFQKFTSGRGFNLALAIGGFTLTYLAWAGFGYLVGRLIHRGRKPRARSLARVTALFFRSLTLLLALVVALIVLHARSDWLLLGLLILLLVRCAMDVAAIPAPLHAGDPHLARHGQRPGRRTDRLRRGPLAHRRAESLLDPAQPSVTGRHPALAARPVDRFAVAPPRTGRTLVSQPGKRHRHPGWRYLGQGPATDS